MSREHESDGTFPIDRLERGTADSLLAMCELGAETPARKFMRRFASEDGTDWMTRSLRAFRLESGVDGLGILLEGAGGLRAAEELKGGGKAGMANAEDGDSEPRAVLYYLAAVCAALVHHDRMISTRRPSVLAELVMDIADAVPEPIRSVLARAVDLLIRAEPGHCEEPGIQPERP